MEYRKIADPTAEEGNLLNNIVESAGSSLRVVVNKECQLACSWCYSEGVDHQNAIKVLTADTFMRIMQVAKLQGFSKINFSGGEPLLYPELFNIQREIGQQGMKSYVTTNGVLINSTDAIKRWKDIPNHEVHISLNTLDEEEYKKITRRDLLRPVLKGISKLADANIPFKFNTVVASEADWPRIKKVLDYAGEMNATVKLLGIHDADQAPFNQKNVAEMILKNGAQHVATSDGEGVNYGFEQFLINNTKVHVLDMIYGGGCCERFKKDQCGEGIRYPRIIYSGEVKPCLHQSIGAITNESSPAEIGNILEQTKKFIQNLAQVPFYLDSIK